MLSSQGTKLAMLRTKLHSRLKRCNKQCMHKPYSCKVYWNEIEELSSAVYKISHKTNHAKTDLDAFCEEYPCSIDIDAFLD